MTRKARLKSSSEIYHVMVRGINKRKIFHEDADYKRFIGILRQCKELSGFKLLAFCLMENHFHLLIKTEDEDLGLTMQRICSRYALWFNNKYERVGHLFQNRFKSEPVNDEKYFFTVIRYIINNPVKAKICNNYYEYKYSSGIDYLYNTGITDKEFLITMLRGISVEEFLMHIPDEECLDCDDESVRINDSRATSIIRDIADVSHPNECSSMPDVMQRLYIQQFRSKGLSMRQISRLTGISIRTIKKYEADM